MYIVVLFFLFKQTAIKFLFGNKTVIFWITIYAEKMLEFTLEKISITNKALIILKRIVMVKARSNQNKQKQKIRNFYGKKKLRVGHVLKEIKNYI